MAGAACGLGRGARQFAPCCSLASLRSQAMQASTSAPHAAALPRRRRNTARQWRCGAEQSPGSGTLCCPLSGSQCKSMGSQVATLSGVAGQGLAAVSLNHFTDTRSRRHGNQQACCHHAKLLQLLCHMPVNLSLEPPSSSLASASCLRVLLNHKLQCGAVVPCGAGMPCFLWR